jgi:hypothetical protein
MNCLVMISALGHFYLLAPLSCKKHFLESIACLSLCSHYHDAVNSKSGIEIFKAVLQIAKLEAAHSFPCSMLSIQTESFFLTQEILGQIL